MKKQEKATEPSMEEILASIRKIIAEEPIGSRPEPARRNPRPVPDQVPPVRDQAGTQGERAPAHPGETRHGVTHDTRTVREPIAIDDALADLVEQPASEAAGPVAKAAQGGPVPTAVPPAAAPAAEPRQRPSWLFSHPHPIPDVAPLAGGRHEPSRPVGPLPSPRDVLLSAVRVEPEPVTGDDELHTPSAVATPALKAPGGESAVAVSPAEAAVDHGAVIARHLEVSGPSSGRDLPPTSGRDSTRLQRGAEPPTAEATPKSTAGPGAPVCGTQYEAPPSPSPGPAGTEAAEPIGLKTRTSETVGPADAALRPAAVSSSTALPVAETADTTIVAAKSALNALSQGLAASAGTPCNAADENSAAAPVTQAVRTLEDTVADLLRPMLRQWLDANMPRIVEKALRVELADGLKTDVKTGPR